MSEPEHEQAPPGEAVARAYRQGGAVVGFHCVQKQAAVDKEDMRRAARSFGVVIRWRSRMHPEWEIDTRHGRFETAAHAALAANGFGKDGIEELRLENRRLALIDIRGRRIAPHDGVTVWKLSDGPLGLPCEMLFERVAYTVAELSALGFDGGFEARQYRVIENDSGRDVPLRLTVGRSRILVVLDKRRADDDVPTA